MRIETQGLTHTYMPDSPFTATAIRDVTLSIQTGEFVGVVGHTGSGKSTLVQHFNGLLRATGGLVTVDGTDIPQKGGDMRSIRRKVGMVFQYPEYQLFEETVEKDIAFGPKNLGIEGEELDARIRKALEDVHLDYDVYASRSPFDLSGGQKRRVAIAGVLAMQPDVLILDEPSAGLDPRGREEVAQLMRTLHDRGATIVMISHSMDEIAMICDRVLVMNHGELWMQGTPSEVFARAKELRGAGLDVPEAVSIADALRDAGWALPAGAVTLEALEEAILSTLEEGGAPWR